MLLLKSNTNYTNMFLKDNNFFIKKKLNFNHDKFFELKLINFILKITFRI